MRAFFGAFDLSPSEKLAAVSWRSRNLSDLEPGSRRKLPCHPGISGRNFNSPKWINFVVS